MSGMRQAALALHGLTSTDREWMLARLPVERSTQLQELLDELQDIGISTDPQLIRNALVNDQTSAGQGKSDLRGMALSPDQAYAILGNEPNSLIAMILGGAEWPWREDFLSKFTPDRARQIREIALTARHAPALRQAVLEAFSDCAELCPVIESDAALPKASKAWTQLLSRSAGRWFKWTR